MVCSGKDRWKAKKAQTHCAATWAGNLKECLGTKKRGSRFSFSLLRNLGPLHFVTDWSTLRTSPMKKGQMQNAVLIPQFLLLVRTGETEIFENDGVLVSDIVRYNDVSLPSCLFFFKMFKLVIAEHDLISRATPCLICVALLVYFSIRLDFCFHGLLLNKVFSSNVVYHFSLHLKCLVLLPSSQTVR